MALTSASSTQRSAHSPHIACHSTPGVSASGLRRTRSNHDDCLSSLRHRRHQQRMHTAGLYPSNFSSGSLEPMSVFDLMADYMNCKTDLIRAAWHAGDHIGALRIAARFFDRSIDTRAFKRGIDAYNNPDFYRQLGKDPEQIVRDALDALGKRFNLY